jgi:hypothetical protein
VAGHSTERSGESATVGPTEDFVDGYLAALRDLTGPHADERAALVWENPRASASLAWCEGDGSGGNWVTGELEQREIALGDAALAYNRPAQPPPLDSGVVYVLRDGASGRVKIGWTSRPVAQRQRAIEHASGTRLDLVAAFEGTRQDETALHARFASQRIVGEWFYCEGAVAAWTRSL